jgi:hypothetical protein
VNAGEMNDIAGELGDEYAPLLGREDRLRREHQAAASSEPGIVDTVLGTAVSTVHALVRAAWRPIDAGLRLGGLRH